MPTHEPRSAGAFSDWLTELRAALAQGGDVVVPCGDCRACCTSSYFVHIEPDESETLSSIPANLLFEAPGLPGGHRVLGYDTRGRCPMFVEGECSIYARRPRTCRVYDCRVFAATGIEPDRPQIAARARRWSFDYPTDQDRAAREAVRAAATFLREHGECFAGGRTPETPARLAVAAIEAYEVFVGSQSEVETVAAVIAARTSFEREPRGARG